ASEASTTLSGKNITEVAKETNAELLQNQEFTRSSTQLANDHPIPSMMLTSVFTAQKGDATEAFALADGIYIVRKVKNISKADDSSETGKSGVNAARENLRGVYADELYLQYMAYLRDKHGVSDPNEAIIDSLLQ
ncbi:MAG: hypothetical protein MK052_05450, partial [Alphaproteobacteria bacterium]|nr:hypothetical protein [Alphaproteobacteria bacterium]